MHTCKIPLHVCVRERKKRLSGGDSAKEDFVSSASSAGGTWGLSLTKDIWCRSAVEGSGEGRRAVECDGSSLARLGSQAEQLKRWHQPVGAPRRECRVGWHISEREAQVCRQ